ncbi:MAG TPA: hypothetical protein VGO93_27725 [Candidatus Xenobia bacterium]
MNALWPVYRLQQLDLKIMALEAQLKALQPDTSTTAVIGDTRRKLAEEEDALRKSSTTLKNLELDLATKEAQKKKNEQKLYGGKVNNSKELTDLQKEIDLLGSQKGELEEQVLGMMDTVDQHKTDIQALKYLLKEQEGGVQEASEKLAADRGALESTLKEWQAKRLGLVGDVDGNLMKKYDHLRRKDGIAVARTVRGTCGSCGMAFAPQSKAKLQEGQLETCKNCGRMLLGDADSEPVSASKAAPRKKPTEAPPGG